MRKPKGRRCACGGRNYSKIRDYCSACNREMSNSKTKTERPQPVPRHEFKQLSDYETLLHLKDLVKRFADLGDSSPVIHYIPGTPEFKALEVMYGNV